MWPDCWAPDEKRSGLNTSVSIRRPHLKVTMVTEDPLDARLEVGARCCSCEKLWHASHERETGLTSGSRRFVLHAARPQHQHWVQHNVNVNVVLLLILQYFHRQKITFNTQEHVISDTYPHFLPLCFFHSSFLNIFSFPFTPPSVSSHLYLPPCFLLSFLFSSSP